MVGGHFLKALMNFTGNLLTGWRGGRSPYPPYVDQWGSQRSPSVVALVDDYKETAYACANLNARAVAATPYHLYALETVGADNTEVWPKHGKVKSATEAYLRRTPTLCTKMAGKRVHEIYQHPVLDLLERANWVVDGFVLFELLDLYCEITGTAYWFMERDELGVPYELWPVPTQFLKLVRGAEGPLYYQYGFSNDRIEIDQIIRFTFPNLRDPYNDLGWSPLRACYESNNLDSKDRAYAQAMYDNRARPDIIVSMKESVGKAERTAIEKSYRTKFARGRTGGVLVLDSAAKVETLTFSSQEMEALARKGVNKVSICNAFDVPLALLETKNINRATLEGAHYQLAKHATLPRLTRFFQRINQTLLPLFDPRLFLWFDNPVPDDEVTEATVRKTRLDSGLITINEVRADDEKEPVAWGDQPWMPSTMVQVGGQTADDDQPTVTPESVLQGPQIVAAIQIVTSVSAGDIPRDAGIGILTTTFNLTEDQANAMMGSAGTGATLTPDDDGKPDPVPPPSPFGTVPPAPKPGEGDEPVDKPKPPAPPKDPKKTLMVMVDFVERRITREDAVRRLVNEKWPLKEAYEATTRHTAKHFANGTVHNHRCGIKGHSRTMPKGAKLADVLKEIFAKQRAEVLRKFKCVAVGNGGAWTKAWWDEISVDLSDWDAKMAEECGPFIMTQWEQGAQECATKLGLTDKPELWNVSNPKVRQAINKQTMKFCRETNATTTMRIEDARKELRDRLGDALDEGVAVADMVDIVGDIFDGAEEWKAEQIALTESSRALHAGQKMAAKESGVVSGFKWLLSDNACSECQDVAKETGDGIGLDDSFANDPEGGAYADVEHPPLHPSCQCTMTEVLNDLSGDGGGDGDTGDD